MYSIETFQPLSLFPKVWKSDATTSLVNRLIFRSAATHLLQSRTCALSDPRLKKAEIWRGAQNALLGPHFSVQAPAVQKKRVNCAPTRRWRLFGGGAPARDTCAMRRGGRGLEPPPPPPHLPGRHLLAAAERLFPSALQCSRQTLKTSAKPLANQHLALFAAGGCVGRPPTHHPRGGLHLHACVRSPIHPRLYLLSSSLTCAHRRTSCCGLTPWSGYLCKCKVCAGVRMSGCRASVGRRERAGCIFSGRRFERL